MLNVADHAAYLLTQLAAASGKLSFATLLSPKDFAERAQRPEVTVPQDQWWLCANVPSSMFRLARKSPLRHMGKVVRGDVGTVYVVLAQQAGDWQNRLVLQLAGHQMQEYLSASYDRGFVLSLGHEERDESLVVPDCRYLQPFVGAELKLANEPSDVYAIAREAMRVAAAMLQPDAVTADDLEAVRHVCVSLVVSKDLSEWAVAK